ncbi:MAG: hypothetical protein ABSD08_12590 [Xanthobacteraceae bacterium]|jgi:hypothetical protein
MAVFNLYSKRKKAVANAGKPDVYKYDNLPQPLRVQIMHLWNDLFGQYENYPLNSWLLLHDWMAREKGVFQLGIGGNPRERCIQHFATCSIDDALDMIELSFGAIENPDLDEAIEEPNQRFREHGVGYQFSGGTIIRVDSEYVHAEVVKPALALLSDERFAAANEEFLTAHRHYREDRHKDCVVAANRAFETTLKTICRARGWAFDPGDRASELVTLVRNQGLLPPYLDRGLDTYVALLKTGLPGVRNSAGGHGDDPAAPPVPGYIAAHALHLTAANIVLLVEAFNQNA